MGNLPYSPLGYTTVPPKTLVVKFGTNPVSLKLNTLDTWCKRQTPLEICPRAPLGTPTVPPKALVAKFQTNPLSFKQNTLEAWGKRQITLEIYLRAPLGTLQCHQRPWWPNSELIIYLLS